MNRALWEQAIQSALRALYSSFQMLTFECQALRSWEPLFQLRLLCQRCSCFCTSPPLQGSMTADPIHLALLECLNGREKPQGSHPFIQRTRPQSPAGSSDSASLSLCCPGKTATRTVMPGAHQVPAYLNPLLFGWRHCRCVCVAGLGGCLFISLQA